MTSEKDILTAANELIKQHGDRAILHAQQRMDGLNSNGDGEGAETWRRIREAIKLLTAEVPPDAQVTKH